MSRQLLPAKSRSRRIQINELWFEWSSAAAAAHLGIPPVFHLLGRSALGLFKSPKHVTASLCPRKMQEASFHPAVIIAAKPSASPVTWLYRCPAPPPLCHADLGHRQGCPASHHAVSRRCTVVCSQHAWTHKCADFLGAERQPCSLHVDTQIRSLLVGHSKQPKQHWRPHIATAIC